MTDQLLLLPLHQVAESKTNPRSQFDEDAIAELAASIKEKGVIQPIVVRPDADGFEIVCGARRYRASVLAGREDIPAIVRELSDKEAFDFQVIENLQRKDVHPLDEAVAFNSMQDFGYTIMEISTRVGKSTGYITQRMKLNDLTADLKKVFFSNKMFVQHAIQICRLSKKDQDRLFQSHYSKWKEPTFTARSVGKLDEAVNNAMLRLNVSPFDIKDETLLKKVPACTACPKNTACNTLLFPELVDDPRCTDAVCFDKKQDAHIVSLLIKAKEDPSIYLLNENDYSDQKYVEIAAEMGLSKPLRSGWNGEYDAVVELEEPELVTSENFHHYGDDEDYAEAFAEAVEDYKLELEQYNKDKAEHDRLMSEPGNKTFGLHLSGSKLGHMILIKLKGKKVKDQEAVVDPLAGYDTEIGKIRERDKRSKELDDEKVHVAIMNKFKEIPVYMVSDKDRPELMDSEWLGVLIYLIDSLPYDSQRKVWKELGVDQYRPKHAELAKVKCTPQLFAFVARLAMVGKFAPGNNPKSLGAFALMNIAPNYIADAMQEIKDAQQVIADKRTKRNSKRIADLTAAKKTAKSEEKKKAKEPAPEAEPGKKKKAPKKGDEVVPDPGTVATPADPAPKRRGRPAGSKKVAV